MENYVGKRLDGRYEIQDVIGVGGMAIVYKAYDNIEDRIVAVKVLKDEYLANEEFRRRFKNESKAIAVLSHPNIVKVFDVSFGDRLQYIVMEYVEGITLKEYIEKCGNIDWNEALFFIIQILRVLQHAHDKGIVHRDVKPQNIMLLENGTIKVTDFGIARFSHSETRTVTEKAIGSVHYISPEQAKGELTDEKADIYSVGIVLYEMLTGKLPFDGDSAVAVALMQVNDEATLPRMINSDIPMGFEQITMKAMQKVPRERYQTAAEMLLDLEELKRNPNIKFDYRTYFIDKEPTRPINKIQEKKNITVDYDDFSDTGVRERVSVSAVTDVQNKTARRPAKPRREAPVAQKKNKNGKTVAIVAGIAVALVIFIIVLIVSMLKNGNITLGVGKKIEVDNFIGLNYEELILGNEEYEKKYNFETYYASFSDGEEGCVYDQDPKAGDTIPKGSTIRLYIVKAGEGQVIPDFTAKNYKEACDSLERLGFKVTTVPIESDDLEIGQVVRTEPAANSSVLAGSTVTVYYAADVNSNKLFKMPKLEGKSLDEAKELLKKNGLVLTKIETADSSIEKDYVINQSPADGSPVKEGDSVVLTVSSGCLNAEKLLNLPRAGKITVKVMLDGETIKSEVVDTNNVTSYLVNVSGNQPESKIEVYLNEALYYEATVDFTREPVNFKKEKTNDVAFYVDVIGMEELEAIAALNANGYKNITLKYEVSFEKAGTVIKQSPVYNSAPHLDKTTLIVLTVAKEASAVTTEPSTTPTIIVQ